MSSFLSNYRTRELFCCLAFLLHGDIFPTFGLISVMCFSDCGVMEGLNRNNGPTDSSQMLFSEGSKPSNAAEGQSLHHFRCRTPKPEGLRVPMSLHALAAPIKFTDWGDFSLRARDLCRGQHGPVKFHTMHCTGCNIVKAINQ